MKAGRNQYEWVAIGTVGPGEVDKAGNGDGCMGRMAFDYQVSFRVEYFKRWKALGGSPRASDFP